MGRNISENNRNGFNYFGLDINSLFEDISDIIDSVYLNNEQNLKINNGTMEKNKTERLG